jgi:hypothetical protein
LISNKYKPHIGSIKGDLAMRKKLIFIIFGCLFTNTTSALSLVKFLPGMKTGINFSRQYFVSGVQEFYGYPKYKYPTDFLLGVSSEIQISKHLSIITEFLYEKTRQEVALWNSVEDGLYLLDKAQYTFLRIPILLKIKTNIFAEPYFMIGPDLGYLQSAEYITYYMLSHNYYNYYRIKNSESLPKFDISLDLGFGKKFDAKQFDVILETRVVLGLTIYTLHLAHQWRNRGIQLIMGVQLK